MDDTPILQVPAAGWKAQTFQQGADVKTRVWVAAGMLRGPGVTLPAEFGAGGALSKVRLLTTRRERWW